MLGMLLVFATSAAGLAEGVLIRQYNKKYEKGGLLFSSIISLFAMLFFILTDRGGFDFRPEMLPYGIASGVFYAAASLATFLALGCGPFALSMLIISYSGIFSILYGLFILHDPVSPFSVAGIVLMLVSLFLTRQEKKPEERNASLKWLICIVLAFLGNGFIIVLMKMQQAVQAQTGERSER